MNHFVIKKSIRVSILKLNKFIFFHKMSPYWIFWKKLCGQTDTCCVAGRLWVICCSDRFPSKEMPIDYWQNITRDPNVAVRNSDNCRTFSSGVFLPDLLSVGAAPSRHLFLGEAKGWCIWKERFFTDGHLAIVSM